MASQELKRWVDWVHQEKLKDPYFYAIPKNYHGSKLNPNHCLNAKWRAFKRAMEQGRHPDLPLTARMRMLIGELVHKEIERSLAGQYQIEAVAKIPVLDFYIICRADLVGKEEIIDIKTWTRDKTLPTSPEKSHIFQVNTYCFAFKKKKARIWYINYQTGEDVFFTHEADAKMYRDVIAYATLLDWFITNNQEPPHKEGCRCKKDGGE